MIFDYNTAMNYLGNNERLFNMVAMSFINSYINFEDDLIAYCNNKDVENVHFLIHTLKGITLNVGCVDLYQKCIDILPKVNDGYIVMEDINELIRIYNNSYKELLRNIA